MSTRIKEGSLSIATELHHIIAEILKNTGIESSKFWAETESVFSDYTPRNQELLAQRDAMQAQLDTWYADNPEQPHDSEAYHAFLREIGYLVDEGEDFSITTSDVDPEIATIAGPQLVVPVTIGRFALNAANARWGSLYDALYGSDVIPGKENAQPGYDPERGRAVIDYVADFLDSALPLSNGSHKNATTFAFDTDQALMITMKDGSTTSLAKPEQLVGYNGMESMLFRNNGLHIEFQFDRNHIVGKDHPAGIKDVIAESALTTILDCEDSVAVVDAEDKKLMYGNILGLMKGDLEATFLKGKKEVTRTMKGDRSYTDLQGQEFSLPGRSLMLVRTVGHLMTTDAILDGDGNEVPEGILDTIVVGLIALHDMQGNGTHRNSQAGNLYIVKPKMHGPAEVKFTCDLFARVESMLGIKPGAIKIGIMDEERRTTLNLKECIRAAKDRVIFVNTGFLDRTGDEIHTSMEAGPVVRKEGIKAEPWIAAYEDWNVDVGLACGFSGKAQIGKGMWPKPDMLKEMMDTKGAHPMSGANCAWVPSPTAATLHAMHYHQVDVFARQAELAGTPRAELSMLTTLPLMKKDRPTADEVTLELRNNCQSILGYVVRWIDQGVGCSKVPDINEVGLMEDRATLRISSQHIANWLRHGICTEEEVMTIIQEMAIVVDKQNDNDPVYRAMSKDFDSSVAFQAACDLVFKGLEQPNGYTEPILHARRKEAKGN